MSDEVSFNEEQGLPPSVAPARARGIAGMLVRSGIVKTAAQANAVLVVLALLMLAGTLIIVLSSREEPQPPSAAELESYERMIRMGEGRSR